MTDITQPPQPQSYQELTGMQPLDWKMEPYEKPVINGLDQTQLPWRVSGGTGQGSPLLSNNNDFAIRGISVSSTHLDALVHPPNVSQ